MSKLYPCPCCGYKVHDEPPGSYNICPICFWEDDISQLRFPEISGANHLSLIEGQKNFAEFGACEKRILEHVRDPNPQDQRDEKWRPLDPKKDQFETLKADIDYGSSYPMNSEDLYYWRK